MLFTVPKILGRLKGPPPPPSSKGLNSEGRLQIFSFLSNLRFQTDTEWTGNLIESLENVLKADYFETIKASDCSAAHGDREEKDCDSWSFLEQIRPLQSK